MTADRKWVIIGVVLAAAIGIATIWYMCVGSLRQASVDLYTAGNMSDEAFAARNALLNGALLVPPLVGALALLAFLAYSRRESLRIAWRYVWPALAVTFTVVLPLVALFASDTLTVLLSIVPLIFMVYLLRPVLAEPGQARESWQYNFIDHLDDETTREYATETPIGKVVKRVTNARSGTEKGQAILEHPAERGETVIEYPITGIDRRVTQLELHGSFGILQQCMDDAQLGVSKFPPNSGNRVRFEIRVNQEVVLREDISDFGWRPVKVGPFKPQEGSLTVEFRTNSMGDPTWNWAAWSELKLLEPT